MVSQVITLNNTQGFHMRPAGVFTATMGKRKSDVTIKFNGNSVDGKSLMNIIAACIKCGSTIEIVCSGEDEQETLKEAIEIIEAGFGE